MSADLEVDMGRLMGIAEQVLAGTPIEAFGLDGFEIRFVLGYTQRAVAERFADERGSDA